MAWARLQSAVHAVAALTNPVTMGSNCTSGSSLIAYVAQSNGTSGTVSSVKDGGGNSFLKVASAVLDGSAGTYGVSAWIINTPAGDAGTKPVITATLNSSSDSAILVQEVSGLATGTTLAALVDGTPGTTRGTAMGSTGSPSYASGAASEYLVSVYGDDGDGTTWTKPAALTADTNSINTSGANDLAVAYGNSTGGTEAGAWSLSGGTSAVWGVLLLAFKLAAGGTNATVTMGSALAVTTSFPAAVVQAVPVILAVSTSQPAPAVAGGANPAPGTLAAATSQPAVTVSTSGNATATPSILAVAAAQPAATVSTGETASPAVLAVVTSQPSIATQQEVSPALELYGFGSFPAIGSGDTINSVTVSVAEFQSSSSMGAITFQLWDGTSAQIGTTQTGTASTSTSNVSAATFTGVTYSQLATLRVRVYANQDTAAIGATESVDSAELSVSYTPAGGTNATVTPSTLAVTTSQPAVTVTVPVLPETLAVTSGQPAVTVDTGVLPYGSPSGGPWILVFDDEFADPHGTGLPDWTVWADHLTEGDYYRANDGGSEIQWYTHDHRGESVSGGVLTLTARHESPYTADPLCPSPLPGGQTGTYTSGMVQSHPGFSQTYGYFEARIQLPGTSASPGIWPAFWMYTIDDQWPPEMDIAEYGYPGTDSTWHPPSGSLTTVSAGISDGNWHVYGFRWTASAVTAFIDGTQTLNVTSGLSSYPMMLVLNLAVDTGATGSGYPATMAVDYVRAWTTSGVPAQPAITSLSPANGTPTSGSLEASFGAVSGATSYRLTVCPFDEHADGISGSHSNYATGSSSPLTVTGLTNGARYTATIAAVNGTGYSTESLPAPAGVLNANALALPVTLAVATAQPAVTVTASTGATVTPATLAVTTAQPSPSLTTGQTASPGTLAAATAFPAPAVAGGANPAPATLAVSTAQPAVTIATGETVAPGALAVATTEPAPTVTATSSATAGPATLAVSTTEPGPAVAAGTGATVTPAVVATTASVPLPTVSTGETVTPATLAAASAIPAPAVSGGGSASAAPSAVAVTTAQPAVAVSTGETVTPAAVAAAVSLPAVTAAGGANPAPAVVMIANAQPAVAVSGSATASPATLAAAASVPAPAVTAGGSASVSPATVAVTVTIPAPAVTQDTTVTPAVVAVTITAATPAIGGGASPAPAVLTILAGFPVPATSAGVTVILPVLAVSASFPAPGLPPVYGTVTAGEMTVPYATAGAGSVPYATGGAW